mgnify:CR=1 FL=1
MMLSETTIKEAINRVPYIHYLSRFYFPKGKEEYIKIKDEVLNEEIQIQIHYTSTAVIFLLPRIHQNPEESVKLRLRQISASLFPFLEKEIKKNPSFRLKLLVKQTEFVHYPSISELNEKKKHTPSLWTLCQEYDYWRFQLFLIIISTCFVEFVIASFLIFQYFDVTNYLFISFVSLISSLILLFPIMYLFYLRGSLKEPVNEYKKIRKIKKLTHSKMPY